jgi:hypothetical protein
MKAWKLLVAAAGAVTLVGCGNMFKKPAPVAQPEPEPVVYVRPIPKPVVQVHGFRASKPGRGGLTDAHISFSNVSDQTFQFVMFKTRAYNADGKIINAKKTNRPDTWLRVAGPFSPFSNAGEHKWDKIWSNRKATCFEVEGVEVIYMNGANEYYNESRLSEILDPSLNNSCRPALAQQP